MELAIGVLIGALFGLFARPLLDVYVRWRYVETVRRATSSQAPAPFDEEVRGKTAV